MSLALSLKKHRMKSKKSLQELADEVGASKAHIIPRLELALAG